MPVSGNWRVLFHPIFRERYEALRLEARRIGAKLSNDEARQHPTVKRFAAVNKLLTDVIVADPNAPDFRLVGDLSKFRRAHGYGLPERYRLFWVFSSAQRIIIVLYLNDPETLRKSGAHTDPYAVFAHLVDRGDIGENFEANLSRIEEERKQHDSN
jgi:toxin YhaV